jgi:divalent metal cation (Fe/Co/Zn/Cd) transporter
MASVSDLLGERSPQAGLLSLGAAVVAVACLAALWLSKRPGASIHPALALDADRTRTLFELAALLLAGSLLGRWFPWADAATGLVMAVGLFVEGRTLARGTTLAPAACGGGCGGCG